MSPRLLRTTVEEKTGREVKMKTGNSLMKIYELAKKLLFLKSIILVKRLAFFFFFFF